MVLVRGAIIFMDIIHLYFQNLHTRILRCDRPKRKNVYSYIELLFLNNKRYRRGFVDNKHSGVNQGTKMQVNKGRVSYFDGGLLQFFGWSILGTLVTVCRLGYVIHGLSQ